MGVYTKGEKKVRAGVYHRYDQDVPVDSVVSAIIGEFCVPFQSSFGPLDEMLVLTNKREFEEKYIGGGTSDVVTDLFAQGAKKIYAYRLGTGGTKGSLAVKNTESTPATVVTLSTKHVTDIVFSVSLKSRLNDSSVKELTLYNGASVLEKLTFASDSGEIDNLVEAVNTKSEYLDAVKASGATGTLETLSGAQFTSQAAPTVTNNSYTSAFDAFEPVCSQTHLVLDTVSEDVKALAKAYVDRLHDDGSNVRLIIGEATTSTLATRMTHASSYNAPYVIYLGSGFYDVDGNMVDGYRSIAIQAGIIGCTDSYDSIVHKPIPVAASCIETLKLSEYEDAIKAGLLLLSESSDGTVWFDSAINTYVNMAYGDDVGWKKIKRTAIRYEVFDRIDRTLEPLIGQIPNNDDGITNIIQQATKVLDEMVIEGKITENYQFYEDSDNPHSSDYAYFIISIQDIDALEKIYLTYRFQYSAAE